MTAAHHDPVLRPAAMRLHGQSLARMAGDVPDLKAITTMQ